MTLWNSTDPQQAPIHSLGNGRLCAYGQGPDLIQVFGPPYSAPSFFQLVLQADRPLSSETQREPGAAVWMHRLSGEGLDPSAPPVLTDWVDAQVPCLIRQISTPAALDFRLPVDPRVKQIHNNARATRAGADGGLLLEAPAGIYLYHIYPIPEPAVFQICWKGNVRWEDGLLRVGPGAGWIYLAGGPTYPEAVEHAEAALRMDPNVSLEETKRSWQADLARLEQLVPSGFDRSSEQKLREVIEDTAVLIKAQQSVEGGVLAGHNYHMCYVRDQYGVSRGLLAMGLTEEAKAILEFYWNIWKRHGRIHNAQAAGVDGVFHVHENDRSETPGYLIVQAFDLLQAAGCDDFLVEILPMLKWAWEVQKAQLAGGMMPFNGDETYIAGGILPRTVLDHGAAEATLLFIEGGERLLNWVEAKGMWSAGRIAENRCLVAKVRATYRDNFWRDGNLWANQPSRLQLANFPRFRHGGCERCVDEGTAYGIEWTERDENGRYLCPTCLAKGPYKPAPVRSYLIQSVSLVPAYLHSTLIPQNDLRPLVQAILTAYQETGKLPSRPDDDKGLTVGYDYGMLLYAIKELGGFEPKWQSVLFEKTLSLALPYSGWSEYYRAERPFNTRCRPWESAINIEALIK